MALLAYIFLEAEVRGSETPEARDRTESEVNCDRGTVYHWNTEEAVFGDKMPTFASSFPV